MTQEEFNEVKGIALELKASGQSEVRVEIPIVVPAHSEGVTIFEPSIQVPYEVVVQVQLVRTQSDQPRRQPKVESPVA